MRIAAYGLLLMLAVLPLRIVAAAEIPPVPALEGKGFFIQDYAGLIDEATRERIGSDQQQAFENQQTPIIVVTINQMSSYGHSGSIESLATEWFNAWKIGTADREGGANKGILLLVSVGDRKARIELGEDWGRRWDGHCESIMQTEIIPHFKQGDYGAGIASGVSALRSMAEAGPEGTPPALSSPGPIADAADKGSRGLGGCGDALLTPFLVIGGILASWFGGGRRRGSSGGFSGGGFHGGGFSGGSSGGGGASGSW